MSATILKNRQAMQSILRDQVEAESLILFPECALTGFHRALKAVAIQSDIEENCAILQRDCDEKNVAIVFGTPWFLGDGIVNAAVYLAPNAPREVASKVGLTESERLFFSPGRGRPVYQWRGKRFSIVFCREVLDDQDSGLELAEQLDFILWPGYIAWSDDPENYFEAARNIAEKHRCAIYQCNWPDSLNDPQQKKMGGSLVIGASGETIDRAAFDNSALLKVAL